MINGFIGFAERKNDPDKILYTAVRGTVKDLYKWASENKLKIFKIQSLLDFQHEEAEEK
jgi:hypothetical protein